MGFQEEPGDVALSYVIGLLFMNTLQRLSVHY